MKALMIYIAMLASATGLYHAVNRLQIATDAPILAIARAQQRNGFDAQWTPATPAQGAAAVAAYRAATGADVAAMRSIERKEFAP